MHEASISDLVNATRRQASVRSAVDSKKKKGGQGYRVKPMCSSILRLCVDQGGGRGERGERRLTERDKFIRRQIEGGRRPEGQVIRRRQ